MKKKLESDEALLLVDKTKDLEITLTHRLGQRQKDIIFAGGLLPYTVGQQG